MQNNVGTSGLDGSPISENAAPLDHLGCMIVNTDGSLSRIPNWNEMTKSEQEMAVRLITKRNKARLAVLREKQAEEAAAAALLTVGEKLSTLSEGRGGEEEGDEDEDRDEEEPKEIKALPPCPLPLVASAAADTLTSVLPPSPIQQIDVSSDPNEQGKAADAAPSLSASSSSSSTTTAITAAAADAGEAVA